MEFRFTDEQQAWREEVRSFLWEHRDLMVHTGDRDADWERAMAFTRALGRRGWLAAHWPVAFGGRGLSYVDQAIFTEEMSYARAPLRPSQLAVRTVGPTLIVHGTDEQQRAHLPRIAAGEEVWCQGFSEPGAGSDLAGLSTRADLDGDWFVVNGAKIWTSGADRAEWCLLAARTDFDAPKHRGITLFLCDMRSAGITVSPLLNLASDHTFNQVYFENVRIPVANVIGEVNRGWYCMTTTLDFERSGIHRIAAAQRTVDAAVGFYRERRSALPAYQVFRARQVLASLAIAVEVGRLLAYRVAMMQDRGLIPNHEASMSKLYAGELQQRVAQGCAELTGMYAQASYRSDEPASASLIQSDLLDSVSATIAGGTSEIQRNIMAIRGLGLPRA